MAYFKEISTNDPARDYGYLTTAPRKNEVLNNAKIDGKTAILANSNNRAITIKTRNKIYLQSYDTLILSVDTKTGEIKKLFNGFSVTTLKHINEFLQGYNLSFNKKTWLNFKGCFI